MIASSLGRTENAPSRRRSEGATTTSDSITSAPAARHEATHVLFYSTLRAQFFHVGHRVARDQVTANVLERRTSLCRRDVGNAGAPKLEILGVLLDHLLARKLARSLVVDRSEGGFVLDAERGHHILVHLSWNRDSRHLPLFVRATKKRGPTSAAGRQSFFEFNTQVIYSCKCMDTVARCAFYINVDTRLDRRRSMERGFGSSVARVPAYDVVAARSVARQLALRVSLNRSISSVRLAELACTLSHRRVFREAIAQNCSSAIVLEDDVSPLKGDAIARMREALRAAPRGTRIVQFLTNHPFMRSVCGADDATIERPLNAWGTAAYAITRQGMQFLAKKPITQRYAVAEFFVYAGRFSSRSRLYIGKPMLEYASEVVRSDIQTEEEHAQTTLAAVASAPRDCRRIARCQLLAVTQCADRSVQAMRTTIASLRAVCGYLDASVIALRREERCEALRAPDVTVHSVAPSRVFRAKLLFWIEHSARIDDAVDSKVWLVDDDVEIPVHTARAMALTNACIVQPSVRSLHKKSYRALTYYPASRTHNRNCRATALEQQVVALRGDFFHAMLRDPLVARIAKLHAGRHNATDWGIDCIWCELAARHAAGEASGLIPCAFLGQINAMHRDSRTIVKDARFYEHSAAMLAALNVDCRAECLGPI